MMIRSFTEKQHSGSVPLEVLPACVALGTTSFEQHKQKSINQLSYSWNLEPKHIVYEDDTVGYLLISQQYKKRKKKNGGWNLLDNVPNFRTNHECHLSQHAKFGNQP